jgi:CBS domain-containing protein
MVRDVITVKRDDKVADAVELLSTYDISALPVVDENGKIVGILSEADLIQREEIGTQNQHQRWLEAILPASKLAKEFAKSHGQRVEEVMTTRVVAASENTSLSDIAKLLEKHRIKRIPIVENGVLVGIVSRSNLIQALASAQAHAQDEEPESDRQIRLDLLDRLAHQQWTDFGERNVIVNHGIVHLWGLVGTAAEHRALLALAEEVPGVVSVSDEMIPAY